jgi:hypothetical protein
VSAQGVESKTWTTLKARAALSGYALLRTDPVDGPVRLLVERFGLIRQLGGLDDVEELLAGQESNV